MEKHTIKNWFTKKKNSAGSTNHSVAATHPGPTKKIKMK